MLPLVELCVKPYYLFQGDLVQGTRHLRVPLARGMEIVRQLRTQLSGIAMPQYAVDLPGGGGKIPLTESYIEGRDEEKWLLRATDGRLFHYPCE